jgi:3-phosphoshikimate 1-carboxyvinyltransferase
VPGSKSITNRAFVLAALAQGTTVLRGVLESDDTEHMRAGLGALGIPIVESGPEEITIEGGRERLRAPTQPLYVGNSGTTVRFLTALACLVDGEVTLVGDEAMARRPILDLVEGLAQLGVAIECPTGSPPLTVRGGRLPGGTMTLRGDRSSQYLSAVMMAGGSAEGDIQIRLRGELVSRPYVEITRRMVTAFGGAIEVTPESFVIRRSVYRGRKYTVEPDASSASYPFALAAGSGGAISVPRLGIHTLQGDYAFVDLLARAGAEVVKDEQRTTVRGTETLRGLKVDMHDISDTAMTLAALAVVASGPTEIRNIGNIRIKETDRLLATVTELERLGQAVTHGADWLRIEPRPVQPATVACYADHRIAMSFAILGLLRDGIRIEDPSCVAKTYPQFWDALGACYRACGVSEPWAG